MTNMTEPASASVQPQKSFLERLPNLSILGPLVALIFMIAFFGFSTQTFFTGGNLSKILQQVMIVGVIGIGQTLVILTAGIDLSCGVVMAFGSIVMTKFAVDYGVPPILAILAGIAATTLFGFINGVLITQVKLPPFIVTLGMLNIATALTLIYSKSQTISGVPDALLFFGNAFTIGDAQITYGVILMIALFTITWLFLTETAPGRHLYAVGNHPEAARLTGIPTNRVILMVYTIAGFIYGIAAWLLVSRYTVGNPNAGQTENLESITAVVLGGTSLFGGRGMIFGTLLGAIIIGVLTSGFIQMGIPSTYQLLITGALVIVAVATDQFTKRKSR
jgi:fructose transport system permease protein